MNDTKFQILTIPIALALLSVPLMGCIGSGNEEDVMVQNDQAGDLDDWGVYYSENMEGLPECEDMYTGKLYFVSEGSEFLTCYGGLWTSVSFAGEQGPQGPEGPRGADGSDGADGAQGPQGPQGPAGADGSDGADGADGAQGPQGPAGADGADGAQGPQGPAGADGSDGADGADGAQGPQGPAGSMPVVMEMTVTVSSMKYFVDGIQQGTLTLYRGFTYNFDLSSVPSFHPFKLGTSANGNQYTSGVATNGNIMSFTVPLDAPNTLYYYCQNHSNMGGTITVNSLGSVS